MGGNAIQTELEAILESPQFRGSRRSQQFLRHVVGEALEGRVDDLKERTIGIAIFGRSPAYDTSEDATVRVAANEVRKRLAQYYLDRPAAEVRIELPLGTYIPEFQESRVAEAGLVEPPADGSAAPAVAPRRWRVAASAGVVLALAVLAWAALGRGQSGFDRFWAPVTGSSQPAVVGLAHPVVYLLADRVHRQYTDERGLDQLAGPHALSIDPRKLTPGDIVPSPDGYVGWGDATGAAHLAACLTRLGAAWQLRIGTELSFSELRSAPAILLGAYSNRWAMQANKEYRFGFDHLSVVDHAAPGKAWKLAKVTADFKPDEDYAIVSRVHRSYTGGFLVTAAGITNFGTEAAAEFITSPAHLNAALAGAPDGWERKNLQLVLRCKVIGNAAGPPVVVAAHYW